MNKEKLITFFRNMKRDEEKDFEKSLQDKLLRSEKLKKKSFLNFNIAKARSGFALLSTLVVLVGVGFYLNLDDPISNQDKPNSQEKINNWQFSQEQDESSGFLGNLFNRNGNSGGGTNQPTYSPSPNSNQGRSFSEQQVVSDDFGITVGGSGDITNFRTNIENGYLPQYTDLTYEGIFSEYYFNMKQPDECNEYLCPHVEYTSAVNPLSNQTNYYATVSFIPGSEMGDLDRKPMNTVIVLDISGSMSSSFNSYYYDGNNEEVDNRSKMDIATDSLANMLDKLHPEDNYAVVLYDNTSYLAKPFSKVKDTDMDAIKSEFKKVSPQGGTNMEAGYVGATKLLEEVTSEETQDRIIFLTDAMPNMGDTSSDSLFGMTDTNSDKGIYTTFIGIGVDFNTQLIEEINNVKGANYFSVNSGEEFKQRIEEEFDYWVTPLAYDIKLSLSNENFEVKAVYGVPGSEIDAESIIDIKTLFPAPKRDEAVKGGVILLELEPKSENTEVSQIDAEVQFTTAKGDDTKVAKSFNLSDDASDGMQKAIELVNYATAVKNWIMVERSAEYRDEIQYESNFPQTRRHLTVPIIQPDYNWEQTSISLESTQIPVEEFEVLNEYLQSSEVEDYGKEVEVLDTILENR